MRTWPLGLLACLPGVAGLAGWPGAADAGDLHGRLALETEYLGEAYYSRYVLTGLDLGLPTGSLSFSHVTEFDEASWLPGPRLDLGWETALGGGGRLRATTTTAWNEERFTEEAECLLEVRGAEGARWGLRALGAVHEDDRSLIADGDWETRLEGVREMPLGNTLQGGVVARWEHSRTLGDSATYLYDYDAGIARLFAAGRGGGGRPWEAWVEGVVKDAWTGDVGSYREARAGTWWRGKSPTGEIALDLRYRAYAPGDTVGNDAFTAELRGRTRLLEKGRWALDMEGKGLFSQYPVEDDLYVDSVELGTSVLGRRRISTWTLTLGPGVIVLEDLHGDATAFTEGRLCTGFSGFFGGGGFADLSVDGGYRDYRAEGRSLIGISDLSASYLRSDYWLLDVLFSAGVPVAGGVTLDATVSASWEFHTRDSERIQITFAHVGVGRSF